MQDDTTMNGFVVGNSTEIDPIYAQGHSHAQLEALKRKLRGISLVFPANVKTAMSPEEDLLALYKKYRYWGSRVRDAQAAPPAMAGYLGLEPPPQEDPTENLRLALQAIAHGPTLAPVLDTPVKTSMDLASSTQLVNSFITPQDDGVLGFMAPPVNTGGTMGGLHRLLMAVSAAGSPGNYKHADHPQDRLEQRTSLPANYTHRLRKVLAKSTLPKGDAYARMPDNSFAVFKDAGGKKRLASFLSKHMTPRGKDITTPVREGLKTAEVYYHGSSKKLESIRAGSWVTPHKEDARSFGVPWSSKDLVNSGWADGRPPQTLEFKPGKEPDDGPVYVYRVDTPEVKNAKTNTGKSYDWNRQVTKDTPVTLVESHPSWKDKLLVIDASKTASIPEDSVAYSAVPDVDSVMEHGLLSSHALAARPDLLEIARPDPEKREAWKKRLASQMRRVHRRGPNVFFTPPDPDKIGPQHYINKDNLKTVEVALGQLMKDQPNTRVYGLELVPFGTEGKRKGYLSHKKLRELLGADPRELWQHYDDPVGRYYAANVPHGAVVTESGIIDPKYLKTAGFANEPLAQKAHQAVVDEYGLTEADGSKYWKLKTHIYKKMGGTFTGRRDPPKS